VLLKQYTPYGVQAVGLRQEALRQRFLIATTATEFFSSPQTSVPFRVIRGKNISIRAYPRNPWLKCMYERLVQRPRPTTI